MVQLFEKASRSREPRVVYINIAACVLQTGFADRPAAHEPLRHHAAAAHAVHDVDAASDSLLALDLGQMLRYAGDFDEAANHYAVPRPPRRGSHRPGAFQLARTSAMALSPRSSRAAAVSPPATSLYFRAPAPLSRSAASTSSYYYNYALQGKRVLATPPLAASAPRFTSAGARDGQWNAEHDRRNKVAASQKLLLRDATVYDGYSKDTTQHASEVFPLDRFSMSFALKEEDCRLAETSLATLRDSISSSSSADSDPLSPRRSILESYARSLPLSASCQSIQKRCSHTGCTKISVSRGLCRGHGGGRRCQFAGCTKSAQSRSNCCWAHGGGQRCDVPGCMRSRKSKRFCVAHVELEDPALVAQLQRQLQARRCQDGGRIKSPSRARGYAKRAPRADGLQTPAAVTRPQTTRYLLPSLGQALRAASRSPPNLPGVAYRVPCMFSV